MPEHDGFEVLTWMRSSYPDRWCPVIVISAHDEEDLILKALSAGADDYMTKPVHHRILIGKINNFRDRLKIQRTNESLLEFVEKQKAELQERLDFESWVAGRIQSVLLMSNLRQSPNGLSIAARAEAATGVNGDFMDVVPLTPDIVDIVLGDVMGKGVLAALMGAEVKQQIARTLVEQMALSRQTLPSPQDVVNSVHQILTPKLIELESFVTLVYLRLNTASKEVTVVSCGHLPPLLLSSASSVELAESQLPIGILTNEIYLQTKYPFLPGDALLLCSDGLVEAQNPQSELYGHERLATVGKTAHDFCQTPGALLEALRTDLSEFCESRRVLDDLTMMVIHAPFLISEKRTQVCKISVERNLTALTALRQNISQFLLKNHYPESLIDNVNLVVVELMTNIIRHSEAGFPNALIELELTAQKHGIDMVIESTGPEFSPPENPDLPDLSLQTEGGFGLFIVHSLTQNLTYQHLLGINQIKAHFPC
jgi:serine phosphatase RsbU (regulator of sigma subunit)/anti-sigma regulatory factor (Ser/Thr protein kinase)